MVLIWCHCHSILSGEAASRGRFEEAAGWLDGGVREVILSPWTRFDQVRHASTWCFPVLFGCSPGLGCWHCRRMLCCQCLTQLKCGRLCHGVTVQVPAFYWSSHLDRYILNVTFHILVGLVFSATPVRLRLGAVLSVHMGSFLHRVTVFERSPIEAKTAP